jgi:transcription elongation GreA/GreB family factor
MTERSNDPVYLTPAGRQRLEAEVARYRAALAEWRTDDPDGTTNDERGDAAERLIEADDLTPTGDMLARAEAILARAEPMPAGADVGVVRLGSTVTVREEGGEQRRLMIVDPAEFDDGESQAAADSPVGRALLGQTAGSQVTLDVPDGRQVLTIQSVAPYKAPTA